MDIRRLKIAVIGRNEEILELIVRLINKKPEWQAIGYLKDEQAVKAIRHEKVDLVLLSSGITHEEEKQLRENIIQIDPEIRLVQHFGGGSGLLYNEIQAAIDEKTPVAK